MTVDPYSAFCMNKDLGTSGPSEARPASQLDPANPTHGSKVQKMTQI